MAILLILHVHTHTHSHTHTHTWDPSAIILQCLTSSTLHIEFAATTATPILAIYQVHCWMLIHNGQKKIPRTLNCKSLKQSANYRWWKIYILQKPLKCREFRNNSRVAFKNKYIINTDDFSETHHSSVIPFIRYKYMTDVIIFLMHQLCITVNHQSCYPLIMKGNKTLFTSNRNAGTRRAHLINSYDHIKLLRMPGLIDTRDLINSCWVHYAPV